MADRRDIDRFLLELEREHGLAKETVQDIREAINTSPYLVSVMTQAIDLGTPRRLEVSNQPNESGHYDQNTSTVSISKTILTPVNDADRLDMIVGTLGHETGHALMGISDRNACSRPRWRLRGLCAFWRQGAVLSRPRAAARISEPMTRLSFQLHRSGASRCLKPSLRRTRDRGSSTGNIAALVIEVT